MRVKIEAGAEFDTLTPAEMRKELADWMVEIARGAKFRLFSARGTVAAGVWTIDGAKPDAQLGPNAGMVWAVTRLAVSGNGFVKGTDTFDVFVNENAPSRLVASGRTRDVFFDTPVLVLNGNDRLVLAGVGTGAGGTDVTVAGQAVELPVELAWQLL